MCVLSFSLFGERALSSDYQISSKKATKKLAVPHFANA